MPETDLYHNKQDVLVTFQLEAQNVHFNSISEYVMGTEDQISWCPSPFLWQHNI
jgi:hypothetical protein